MGLFWTVMVLVLINNRFLSRRLSSALLDAGLCKASRRRVVTLTYGIKMVLAIDGMILSKWITIGEALQSLWDHLAEGNKRVHSK
jgi:hypothetical protein